MRIYKKSGGSSFTFQKSECGHFVVKEVTFGGEEFSIFLNYSDVQLLNDATNEYLKEPSEVTDWEIKKETGGSV